MLNRLGNELNATRDLDRLLASSVRLVQENLGVEIVSPDTLQAVAEATDDSVAALAVFVGKVRLIDNMALNKVVLPHAN